jgi:hypothetical protein
MQQYRIEGTSRQLPLQHRPINADGEFVEMEKRRCGHVVDRVGTGCPKGWHFLAGICGLLVWWRPSWSTTRSFPTATSSTLARTDPQRHIVDRGHRTVGVPSPVKFDNVVHVRDAMRSAKDQAEPTICV